MSSLEDKAAEVVKVFEDQLYGQVKGHDTSNPLKTYEQLSTSQKQALYGKDEDALPGSDTGALDYFRRANQDTEKMEAALIEAFSGNEAGLESMLNELKEVAKRVEENKPEQPNPENTPPPEETHAIEQTKQIRGKSGRRFAVPEDMLGQYEQMIASMDGLIPDNSHGMITSVDGYTMTIDVRDDMGRRILRDDEMFGFKASPINGDNTKIRLEFDLALATNDKLKPEGVTTRAFNAIKNMRANFTHYLTQDGFSISDESSADTLVIDDTYGHFENITEEEWNAGGFEYTSLGDRKFSVTYRPRTRS